MNFKVGDVCVGLPSFHNPKRRGMECVVVDTTLKYGFACNCGCGEEGLSAIRVRWSDGETRMTNPGKLRRIPPKADPNYTDQYTPADPLKWNFGWSPEKARELT